MRKTWLMSSSICLAMGDAVALNLMFETKQDHELFFKFWKKYLGGMADLLNYQLTPTGWVLLFRTKCAADIKVAYQQFRSQSMKAKPENEYHDVSRMLSEHFRIFLSQFVRRTNANHGRKGTKVLQSFHRYVLKDTADYEHLFDMITRQKRKLSQSNSRYQADETSYDKEREMRLDSVWKVGTRVYRGLGDEFKKRFGVVLITPSSSVLRKFLPRPKIPKPKPPFLRFR